MNLLLVYKQSTHPLQTPGRWLLRTRGPGERFLQRDLERFRQARRAHARTLEQVCRTLRRRGIRFRAVTRGRACNTTPYDGVVAVGGDGTFLEAARRVGRQWVLGVNSDPARSTGTFCTAARSFPAMLDRILKGRARVQPLRRIRLELNGKPLPVSVLNDVLVTDRKPAAMSRYWIRLGRREEEQRSSGLWIATAAGSTGAIRSAGGRPMPRGSRNLQYRPRELYRGKISGGRIAPGQRLTVGSLMPQGLICLDGEYFTLPFRYGDLLTVSGSAPALNWVIG